MVRDRTTETGRLARIYTHARIAVAREHQEGRQILVDQTGGHRELQLCCADQCRWIAAPESLRASLGDLVEKAGSCLGIEKSIMRDRRKELDRVVAHVPRQRCVGCNRENEVQRLLGYLPQLDDRRSQRVRGAYGSHRGRARAGLINFP